MAGRVVFREIAVPLEHIGVHDSGRIFSLASNHASRM